MKKYNTRKRGTYKAHTRKIKIYEKRDTRNKAQRIKIHIHYDGYNDTRYDGHIIPQPPRNNETQRYINITNTINDIFPNINAPHNAHTQRANASYHKFIPQPHNHISYSRRIQYIPRYLRGDDKDTIVKDTRTVKCIILNDDDKVLYIGKIRRTRTVNRTRGTIDIILHKGEEEYEAQERAVNQDMIIHGMTIRKIRTYGVEIYYA